MAELEDLSARLSRLAAAVPVAPMRLDQVHRDAVRARQQVRTAWLTPLAMIAIGVVAASALKVNPFAPGTSSRPSGPVSATTRTGDFELTIVSAKGRYEVDEPIDIHASLTYGGSGEALITHAQGAPVPGRGDTVGPDTGGTGGPLGFEIQEPVLPGLSSVTGWLESCEQTTMPSGVAVVVPFAKGGAWSTDDPRSAEYLAWIQDPVLRLSEGAWHITTFARFRIGSCNDPLEDTTGVQMRVGIEVQVSGALAIDATDAPSIDEGETPPSSVIDPPEPSTAPDGAQDTNRSGDFELVLEAGKSHYPPDEAIDVGADSSCRSVGGKSTRTSRAGSLRAGNRATGTRSALPS